jgi:hypothetical protein
MAKLDTTGFDKRAYRRMACSAPCEVFFAGTRRLGMVANLSVFGLYVALAEPLPARDSRVVLAFCLPGDTTPTLCQGRVCWINEPSAFKGYGSTKPSLPPGCGVEFVVIDARDRQRIAGRQWRPWLNTTRSAGSG